MALSQQKFREIVFQLLYSQDIGHPHEDVMIELIMAELSVSKKNVRLAQEKVNQIIEKLSEIDRLISSVSTSYDFDRIQIVTKNILRLGVFELFFDSGIPPKVAIAEAIRLSRKFSTPESASFVNALLDNLYQASLGAPVDACHLERQSQTLVQSEQAIADLSKENLYQLKPDEDIPSDNP
ncbi:transcription antitermination factor NusB [Candidatus Protochlamydia phocaeensis]|uniref:transcription antitermination factor NusB n=1 Tax=Candidatus Protochlamydia phocaeensis TaxID=1414722 RepID=UPI00083834E4|nr:transcription antitermination factor NusB [Candidatus Protochlamydia phocaeensis]